jgi:hypothetical protein
MLGETLEERLARLQPPSLGGVSRPAAASSSVSTASVRPPPSVKFAKFLGGYGRK